MINEIINNYKRHEMKYWGGKQNHINKSSQCVHSSKLVSITETAITKSTIKILANVQLDPEIAVTIITTKIFRRS